MYTDNKGGFIILYFLSLSAATANSVLFLEQTLAVNGSVLDHKAIEQTLADAFRYNGVPVLDVIRTTSDT